MTAASAPWRHLDDAGQALGITPDMADAIGTTWRTFLADHGLEILAIEQTVVNDELRIAGTLDRLVRLTRPMVFGHHTIPAGTVCVLDIKTGALRAKEVQ